jgi:hypothetical protein
MTYTDLKLFQAQWLLYISNALDLKNLYILLRVVYMFLTIIRINSNYFSQRSLTA